jgi:membrane fusion protein (multidrug efflux system)
LLKKHLFLVVAVSVVAVMVILGAVKVFTAGDRTQGPGGPGGFAGGPFGPGGGGGARRGLAVTPAVVTVRSFTDTVEVVGAAKALQSITVTAPASQLVTRINFQSGQFVQRGQVLAELNAREQDAAILQARSQVALAKSNWDRWQQLADRGLAPAATAEQMKAQYDQAVATLQANQARAGDRVIRAPFSGVVGLTDAAPGMLLNAGGALVTLDDLSSVRVDFPVPEQFISLLRNGLPIMATADAYPGTEFNGRVAQLDTRLDPNTRAIMARAEFPNPGSRLRPGMMLRVRIEQGTRQNPAVPESAIVFEGGDSYVLLIAPAPAGAGGPAAGRQRGQAGQAAQGGGQAGQRAGAAGGAQRPGLIALRRSVRTGVRADGFVEVLSGLQAGDRIVSDGTNRVRPNDPISIAGAGGPRQGRPGAGQGATAGGGGQGAAPVGPQRSPAVAPAAAQGPVAGGLDPQTMFQRADANRDGGVSLTEWTGAGRPEQAFGRVDGDGDGKITLQEMQQRQRARDGQAAAAAG